MHSRLGDLARRRRFPPGQTDLLLATAATVALVADALAMNGTGASFVAGTGLALVAGAGIWLRRRAPVAAAVTVVGGCGLYELLVHQSVVTLGPGLVAFYSLGAYAPLPRAAVGLPLALSLTFVPLLGESRSFGAWIENVVFAGLVAGSVWAGGVAVRVSRTRASAFADLASQLEREREEKARLAVAAERARIARELHDVVAHGISVIAVQAGFGRHTLRADPERSQEAFRAIESTARQALVEMRHLLGLLREGNEPASPAPLPGMESHADLIDQARGAGLTVGLDVEGTAHVLPAGVDLAGYRILQEALTNVRKHAPGSRAAVRIRYGAHDLEIEVRNDPASSVDPTPGGDGAGHGLIGMRERVALYQGELDAGPLPDGGFRVRARLPLTDGRP